MLPASHATLFTRCALCLQRAAATNVSPVNPLILAFLLRGKPVAQLLTSRAAVNIQVFNINKIVLAKTVLRFARGGLWLGYQWLDTIW